MCYIVRPSSNEYRNIYMKFQLFVCEQNPGYAPYGPGPQYGYPQMYPHPPTNYQYYRQGPHYPSEHGAPVMPSGPNPPMGEPPQMAQYVPPTAQPQQQQQQPPPTPMDTSGKQCDVRQPLNNYNLYVASNDCEYSFITEKKPEAVNGESKPEPPAE